MVRTWTARGRSTLVGAMLLLAGPVVAGCDEELSEADVCRTGCLHAQSCEPSYFTGTYDSVEDCTRSCLRHFEDNAEYGADCRAATVIFYRCCITDPCGYGSATSCWHETCVPEADALNDAC